MPWRKVLQLAQSMPSSSSSLSHRIPLCWSAHCSLLLSLWKVIIRKLSTLPILLFSWSTLGVWLLRSCFIWVLLTSSPYRTHLREVPGGPAAAQFTAALHLGVLTTQLPSTASTGHRRETHAQALVCYWERERERERQLIYKLVLHVRKSWQTGM